MIVDTNQIITMTEANQNFSKAVKTVDKFGEALILKNNKARYLLIDINNEKYNDLPQDVKINILVEQILKEYREGK